MSEKRPVLELKDISFCYPEDQEQVLKHISLSVFPSEIAVLCGQSGCGKSTLLRHMKKNQIPFGTGSGEIIFEGENLEEMDDREAAARIGYVGQEPDSQIVTDMVWHELAFGLENLGVAPSEIRKRTAEMAEYLGMGNIFRQPVEELSGGQKQLCNLASVLVMKPDLLILDESTAQMDPIAAGRFIQTLVRLNREFGTTIILSEQRLEEVLPIADRIYFMHEGRILSEGSAEKSGWLLAQCEQKTGRPFPVREALPAALRIFTACEPELQENTKCPLSVREGRIWLAEKTEGVAGLSEKSPGISAKSQVTGNKKAEIVLRADKVSFSYRKGKRLLEDFSLEVERGSFFGILGGNGSGKTTVLKLLSGIYPKFPGGKIMRKGKVLYLAQNPQTLFTEVTVEDELAEMVMGERKSAEVTDMLDFLEMTHLRGQNPMDLSGGEKQRLALGKILLRKPEVLLLDEPTKGLDAAFKKKLSKLFCKLRENGMTIVMVSHDLEFCAANATHCGLLFDGCLISSGTVREFFAGNSFYTTSAGRIADGLLTDCLLCEDVAEKVQYIRGKLQKKRKGTGNGEEPQDL